jgi:predicted PurR-regulated permease PerM
MTKAIDLSAPTVIVALLVGSSLAGLAGALIALPIVAVIKVVIRELWPGVVPPGSGMASAHDEGSPSDQASTAPPP